VFICFHFNFVICIINYKISYWVFVADYSLYPFVTMDKAKALQELEAEFERKKREIEAKCQKSPTQLQVEADLMERYRLTDPKLAETMAVSILASRQQQYDVEMPLSSSSTTFLPQQMHTSPPSMVAFQQPMETSSNASLNVPRTVGATLGDRKSEVSLHPSDSISQVSTASGRGKAKSGRGRYADITILPQNLNFKCFCDEFHIPILKGSITTHADCDTHNNKVRDLLSDPKLMN